jgi:hypothetical protein
MEEGNIEMATIEERLTTLEQEHVALKNAVELQTIALQALVTKDAFEGLCDTNNKIFDALMSHDQLTNERLGNQQTQITNLDGKVVGLQTEMRQGFEQQEQSINSRFDAQDKRLDRLETMLAQVLARLPEKP